MGNRENIGFCKGTRVGNGNAMYIRMGLKQKILSERGMQWNCRRLSQQFNSMVEQWEGATALRNETAVGSVVGDCNGTDGHRK